MKSKTQPTLCELSRVSEEIDTPVLHFENWSKSGAKECATIGVFVKGVYSCIGFITTREKGLEVF